MKNNCVEISVFGERNYRLFLDIVKQELDILGTADINAVQAFILLNINETAVTIGEIIARGYYIGSNASYNIKKMILNGYIKQTQSDYDKRAAFLRLTSKGLALCRKLHTVIDMHIKTFSPQNKGKGDLEQCVSILKKVEHFWQDILSRRT
ncbi:MAG: MarR family winged helix-turn-helix transcriptional regulator [Holosporales bacterium]|jgi:DNA-binding MarR family transcriptional regulator|nr:MarR family winged helix-turn-helix transcriptional regulator [Holosporales bacterium]